MLTSVCCLLLSDVENNFYWATVDIPSAASQHGGDESIGSTSLAEHLAWSGRQFPADSDAQSGSSGVHTGWCLAINSTAAAHIVECACAWRMMVASLSQPC